MADQLLLRFMFLTILFSTGSSNPYAGRVSIQLFNACDETIWPGVHTVKGERVTPTGFKMDPKQLYSLNVPDLWIGTIWARTGCRGNYNNSFHCHVGDCGTQNIHCHYNFPRFPVTLLRYNLAPKGGTSYYKVDLKNGYNMAVTLTPIDNRCKKIQCLMDIRQDCPDWLAVYGNDKRKVACKSVCYTTGTAKDCCTGECASPQKCKLNEYTDLVEKTCPSAVSNAFDETHFSCFGGTRFAVSFCT